MIRQLLLLIAHSWRPRYGLSLDAAAPAGKRLNPQQVALAVRLAHWLVAHPAAQLDELERIWRLPKEEYSGKR